MIGSRDTDEAGAATAARIDSPAHRLNWARWYLDRRYGPIQGADRAGPEGIRTNRGVQPDRCPTLIRPSSGVL